jgi:hypothetical protein
MTEEQLLAAHEHSSCHRAELQLSDVCGCFYCCRVFSPQTIKRWYRWGEEEETAHCPFCNIDAVIGSSAGYELNDTFLKAMNERWFLRDVSE